MMKSPARYGHLLFCSMLLSLILLELGVAHASGLRLPSSAFVAPSGCRGEPFVDDSTAQQSQDVAWHCGGERTGLKIESPAVKPSDTQPRIVKTQLERIVSEDFGSVVTSLRLGWSGLGNPRAGSLRTELASVSTGGLMRIDKALALRGQVRLESATAMQTRTRSRLAWLWQPLPQQLIYAEWSGVDDRTDAHTYGLRWWSTRRRYALDIAARLPFGTNRVEPRIGISVPVLGQ